ncbi:apocytochrome c disulfide reductase lipoprotein ResA [Desulfuromonas sp. DDH964]|uniref:TlpA disulfide reductase family protein n=1 Tax=Desulfuromonas sp. DDH964 TaxID=1823759 RepID=UPI00078C951B|nr:TlpA disulfide reductase family protein [Desulfuromonas sp. DDH964]AMV72583.1 apocytochrome c disulfide reductase lipoprotein ResA [Desulfuromonas sp. DDH964]
MFRPVCKIVPLLLLLFFSLSANLVAAGTSKAGPPRVGQLAPDFTLKDVKGRSYTLSELRGKVVLVNFWATWCPPCRAEMPSMEKLSAMLSNDDFVLLAINAEEDALDIVQEYLQESPHSFPVLLDGETAVQQQYGVYAFPETFIIRRDGIIADHVIGAIDWTGPKVLNLIKFLING